ncbi:MAG TPA: hypothetical protein VEW03_01375, partial [Longimicrobiaceae bacterium]|nr:hypothetical protein [Longimicrobiaceae bacterium]
MHLRLPTRTPARLLGAATLIAITAGGCDDFLATPAKAPARLSVSYVLTPASPAAQVGVARAFDQVDRVRIYLARGEEEGAEVLLDSVFTVSGAGGEIRQSVTVELDRTEEELFLGVALLVGASPLFKGSRPITLVAGQESSAEVPLEPVGATLSIAPVPIFPSLGDSARAAAVLLFATGDTVDGALIDWSGLDPGLLEVRPSGWMVARAEGQARLVATAGDVRQ